jgi:hypothetical protein
VSLCVFRASRNQGNQSDSEAFYEYRWKRNFQIDEAYLLLGKARYYDQRFIPPLDAFNYIYINTQTVAISMKLRFGGGNKYAIGAMLWLS